MKKADIEKKCTELVMPIIEEGGFILWDVEYVKEGSDFYLRVYADKEGGIDINDCVSISRKFEAKLDEDDFIKDAYILEVSSPGLTRPLKRDRDFEMSIGRLVEIRLFNKIDNCKEFEGYLKSYTEDTVTVEINEEDKVIERKNLSMIRLAYVEADE